MAVTLHIITPVSRPQNIPALSESIKTAMAPSVNVEWWLVYDADAIPSELPQATCHFLAVSSVVDGKRLHGAGGRQRNAALEAIEYGWVYFLDDDTILHPKMLHAVSPILEAVPGCNVIFNQETKDGKPRLTASPDNVKLNKIDSGQVVMSRESYGNLRWIEDRRDGDGILFQAVFKRYPDRFIFLNQTLSTYNALR